jgi:hypothetical protein
MKKMREVLSKHPSSWGSRPKPPIGWLRHYVLIPEQQTISLNNY